MSKSMCMSATAPELLALADDEPSSATTTDADADAEGVVDPCKQADASTPACTTSIVVEKQLRIVPLLPNKIWTIPSFVSDPEIQHLLDLAENKIGWVRSSTSAGENYDASFDANTQSSNRTSFSCSLPRFGDSIVRRVMARVAAVCETTIKKVEDLNMVRYHEGQFFNEHHDGGFRPKTVFLYLNTLNEDQGGATVFPQLGAKISPLKGAALLWSNVVEMETGLKADMSMVHAGEPPRNGAVKYGINCFVNKEDMEEIVASGADVDG